MTPEHHFESRHPRCLVTGGTGFIGRHLVASLLGSGADVRIACRPGAVTDVPVDHTVVELCHREALTDVMRGMKVVYHLAGVGSPASPPEDYARIVETNVTGTLNVLLAAADAGVQRVVVASSASVYGRVSSPALNEDMKLQPASVYGISKHSAEQLCAMVHQSHGLETVALRYFSVYGPDEDPDGTSFKLIPVLRRRLSNHQPVTLFGDGGQTRDFVHVDDVVTATILAGTVPNLCYEVINVGSGHGISVAEVVRILSEGLETHSEIRYEAERPGEVRHSVANIAKARDVLGFEPTIFLADAIGGWTVQGAIPSYTKHAG